MAEDEKDMVQKTEDLDNDKEPSEEVNSKEGEGTEVQSSEEDKAKEVEELKKKLEEKEHELQEYIELAQRLKAEFENYKKRMLKEKEQLYTDIKGDIILKFLPVLDNLERAISASSDSMDLAKLLEGVGMIQKQFGEILQREGVEEISADGQQFDPNFHNAVMHVEDENSSENTVVEVFQKGYKINDRVLRHSMVKVAN